MKREQPTFPSLEQPEKATLVIPSKSVCRQLRGGSNLSLRQNAAFTLGGIIMLSKLLNKKFYSIHRAVDMLMLNIGDDYEMTSYDKQPCIVSEYALHIQSPWRFRKGSDIYVPYCDNVPDEWEYDIVGRSDELSSIFDVCSKQFSEVMQGSTIVECNLSEINDVFLMFSNGVVFEHFITDTRKCEEWRLIDCANDLHTVCYDCDGEISCD